MSIDITGGIFPVSKVKLQEPQWNCVRDAIGKFRREAGVDHCTLDFEHRCPIPILRLSGGRLRNRGESDGHDFPRLVDERVQGEAAVIDDIADAV